MSMSHVSGAVSCVRTSQDLCSGNHDYSAIGLSSFKPGAAEECGSHCHSHQAEANRVADRSLLSNDAAQVHDASQAEASPGPQELPSMDERTDTTGQKPTQQREACCETQSEHVSEHKGHSGCASANQVPGYSHSRMLTSPAQLRHSVPPPEHAQCSDPPAFTTQCTWRKKSADTHSPTALITTLLPVQSGLSTQSGQGGHEAAQADPANAAWPRQHSWAGQVRRVPPPCQQAHHQQQQAAGVQPTVLGEQEEPVVQSPAEGLPAMLASASPSPSRRKRHIDLTPRPTRPHKSHRTSTRSAGGKQPRRLWQTLGDVLQDLDINHITFRGTPMTRSQSVSAGAGPSTPAALPQQYVDTRSLAYLPLLQQENNQPASSAQPTPTQTPLHPKSLLNCWPPMSTQLQQQQHTCNGSTQHSMVRQAADTTLPLQRSGLATSCHDATHMAPAIQQPSGGSPAMSSPQPPHPAFPPSQGISLQHPWHTGQHSWSSCHSNGSPTNPQNPQSPTQSVLRVLDRLFSGSKAQQRGPLLSSGRHARAHAQPSPNAPHPEPRGANQRPPDALTPNSASKSCNVGVQHCQWPAASGVYTAPPPAWRCPPETPATQAEGSVYTLVPCCQQQWQARQPYQQDAHQAVGLPAAPDMHLPVPNHAHAAAQAETLQHQSPNTGIKQHGVATREAAPSSDPEKPYQALCSRSTRSPADPGRPAMKAQLPLPSPERMPAPSSACHSSPVLLWNSSSSAGPGASLLMPQQSREVSTSMARPLQQENSQQQKNSPQQQQLGSHPRTAMQDRPPWLAVSGRTRSASVIHRSPDRPNKSRCLTSFRPANVMVLPGAQAGQLAGQHSSGGHLSAVEQIAVSAKGVLRSLDLAVTASHLHLAYVHERASSAQLCQDVCGAFNGLPLSDSQACDAEESQDQHSLHLYDLHELGLSPNVTPDEYPDSTNTQHQLLDDSSNTGMDKLLDSSGNMPQQHQRNSPQLGRQQECSTSSEQRRYDLQGTKHSSPKGLRAPLGAPIAAPHRSSIQAAAPTQQQQAEPPPVPDTLRMPDKLTQLTTGQRENHDSSRATLPRQFCEPARHEDCAVHATPRQLATAQHSLHTRSDDVARDVDCSAESSQHQAEALRASAQAVLRGLDWADSQLSCSKLRAAASASAGMHSRDGEAQHIAGQLEAAGGGAQGRCAPAGQPLHIHTPPPTASGQHVDGGLDSDQPVQLSNKPQLERDDALSLRLTAAGGLPGWSEQHCATGDDRGQGAQHAAVQQEGQLKGGRASSGVAEIKRSWREMAEGNCLHGSTPCLPDEQEERLLAAEGTSALAASMLPVAQEAGTQAAVL